MVPDNAACGRQPRSARTAAKQRTGSSSIGSWLGRGPATEPREFHCRLRDWPMSGCLFYETCGIATAGIFFHDWLVNPRESVLVMTTASRNTSLLMSITACMDRNECTGVRRSMVRTVLARHPARICADLSLYVDVSATAPTTGGSIFGPRRWRRAIRAVDHSPSTPRRPAGRRCHMPGKADPRLRSPRRPRPVRGLRVRGETASRYRGARRAWVVRPPRRGGGSGFLNPFQHQADSRPWPGCRPRGSGRAAP